MHDGDTLWKKLLDQIDRQGWGWQVVGPDPGDDEHEPFPHYCYTVGLVSKGLPDLIIVGLDIRTSIAVGDELITRAMTNAIVGKAVPTVSGFKPFDLNQELLDVFKGTRAMLVDVPPAEAAKRSLFAHDYAAAVDKAPELIQLVWPDRSGRLPFEEGADPRVIEAQPVLKYVTPTAPNPTAPRNAMNTPVRLECVRIHGLWMPVEYETQHDKVIIRCLGDIERVCLDLPRRWLPLDEALRQYFDAVPQSRKMVVLVPRDGVSSDRWACRQALKSDLVAEIEESIECASA